MTLREFMRFHLLKVLLIFVGIQVGIVAIIQNYNHPPHAWPDRVSMIEGRRIEITPLLNDSDKDVEDVITLLSFTTPAHGSVEQKEKMFYYTPGKGFTAKYVKLFLAITG